MDINKILGNTNLQSNPIVVSKPYEAVLDKNWIRDEQVLTNNSTLKPKLTSYKTPQFNNESYEIRREQALKEVDELIASSENENGSVQHQYKQSNGNRT